MQKWKFHKYSKVCKRLNSSVHLALPHARVLCANKIVYANVLHIFPLYDNIEPMKKVLTEMCTVFKLLGLEVPDIRPDILLYGKKKSDIRPYLARHTG